MFLKINCVFTVFINNVSSVKIIKRYIYMSFYNSKRYCVWKSVKNIINNNHVYFIFFLFIQSMRVLLF